MPLTRAFKSGNSQAVRIPAELAYEDTNVELSIDRYGDVIVISPVRGSMADAVAKLRALAKRRGQQVREPIEMPDRAWD
jgi:antitoxin VapB